jgi:hypothetical protein
MSAKAWIYRLSKYVRLRAKVSAKVVYHRGTVVLAVWLKPPRENSLRGLADIFHPPHNVGGAQFMCGVPGGVHSPAHLAYLMGPALKRRNTPADKAGNNILWRQAGITKLAHNPVEGIDDSHGVPRIMCLVLHVVGRDINVSR